MRLLPAAKSFVKLRVLTQTQAGQIKQDYRTSLQLLSTFGHSSC